METTTRPVSLVTTALAAAAFGAAELAFIGLGGEAARGGSLPATLAAATAAWFAMGLMAAIAGRVLAGRLPWLEGAHAAPALALALFVAVRLIAITLGHWNPPLVRLAEFAGATLAALLVARCAAPVFARLPLTGRAPLWLVLWALASAGAWFGLRTPAHDTSAHAAAPTGAPSLLLVTIDTLRADYLGAYGHAAARTPVFDALAARGYLFEDAVTHSVFTGPSHATILTGLLPVQHGLTENMQRLDHAVPSLADRLSAAGWDTGAFVSGFPVTQHASALMERFETYDDDLRRYKTFVPAARETALGSVAANVLAARGVDLDPDWRKAPEVTDRARSWLASDDAPFFGWVHYYDPHLPYEPPERLLDDRARAFDGPPVGRWYHLDAAVQQEIAESPASMAQMSALYDAEIALVDEHLGRLVEAARARAGDAGLWIIVTADHGESFGEHGIYWRRELYEPTLHVPLIVVPPAASSQGAPRRVPDQVRLIDIAPTVFDALDVSVEASGDGVSLLPLASGAAGARPGPAISMMFPTRAEPYQRTIVSVRDGGWKSIWKAPGWINSDARLEAEVRELYELRRDAGELQDLAPSDPAKFDELHALSREIDLSLRPTEDLSEADLRRLRNLGYAE